MVLSTKKIALEESLGDLEKRLNSEGVDVNFDVDVAREIRRLSFGWLGEVGAFLYTIYHSDFGGTAEKRSRKNLRTLLAQHNKRRDEPEYNLDLVTEGWRDYDDLEMNYIKVGTKINPNYERDVQEHPVKLQQYEDQVKLNIKKREEILNSKEGILFQYVESEDRKTICSTCYGAGVHSTGQSGIGDVSCSDCGGSGDSGYTPNVTEEQRKIAATIEKTLDSENLLVEFGRSVEDHIRLWTIERPTEPQRDLTVYIHVK